MTERCEICESTDITHRCAGLDVPQLAFCAEHAAEHAPVCPEIQAGRSWMNEIRSAVS